MSNARIEKYKKKLEEASGNEAKLLRVLDEISDSRASITLGRKFLESVDDYLDRKPELKEFVNWTATITITPKCEVLFNVIE